MLPIVFLSRGVSLTGGFLATVVSFASWPCVACRCRSQLSRKGAETQEMRYDLLLALPSALRACDSLLPVRLPGGTAARLIAAACVDRIDDQHVLAEFRVFASSSIDFRPRSSSFMSASAVHLLGHFDAAASYSAVAVGAVDFADGAGDFLEIAQEDFAAVALLLHSQPLADVHAQLAADGLQAEADFLLNLRIAGDRFLRFAGERHPHAGDVDHDADRPLGHAAARLAAGRSSASWCCVIVCVIAQAGLLELQRHAVGVAQHFHRLAFGDVDVLHRREQPFDVLSA